jgi:hypothetical protein
VQVVAAALARTGIFALFFFFPPMIRFHRVPRRGCRRGTKS